MRRLILLVLMITFLGNVITACGPPPSPTPAPEAPTLTVAPPTPTAVPSTLAAA